MSITITPFTKQQLLPQEEKLEIARKKSELFIGIPKETSHQERRICLTPDAVNSLTFHGHRVMIEAGAGLSSSYTDKEYSDAGAEITNDTKKVFSCPMILKVEPATLAEIGMMNPKTILLSAIQLKTRKKTYFEALKKKKITALAFEYIKDEIEKISSAEEKEILDEAKAIEQEAYNQLRGEAEIDAKHQLDKELAEISSKASIEASAQLEERLKKLVEKREEYVNTIFTEVKNKLVEFVNSSNYLEYLTSHVKAVSDEYQMTDCVLCVRKEDLKYADDLKKAYALPIEVEEGQQIQLGGFIIENKTTNVVVDESLDSNLEAQKDWFYKTSGLMIK